MRGQNNNKNIPRPNQIFFWALTGDFNSLKTALEGGMSVNVIDPVTTDSPLMIACRKGHTEVVRLCLEYGAKNDPHPEFGQTALHASIAEQKINSAKVLLEVAAESDADHIISNLTDPSGQTPLHTACYIGSTPLIELLLHHGAEMSSVDHQGQTSLHLCASSGVKTSLAMLLDHGGDELIDIQDNGGNTALHHATFHGRLDCVRLLLETAANVCIRNYEGLTPYNIASAQGHHQIGLLLLEYRDIHNGAVPAGGHSSNLPTPNKSKVGSLVPTPLHYQTPQSISKYGRQGSQDYAYSPSNPYTYNNMPEYEGIDNNSDSPERVTVLNIRPPQQQNHHQGKNSSTLGLQAPANLLSSMYGMNGGMENLNLDSINSFLPRPHTVSSPSMHHKNGSGGGSHPGAAQRSQSHGSSANGSPIVYSGTNPLFQKNGAQSGGLTQRSMAQHNRQHHPHSIAITSPMPLSPHSEPGSLENGAGGNGYKVLPKQHHNHHQQQQQHQQVPSLSRQSTESLASKQSNASDPGPAHPIPNVSKIQLFDGIQTYTKASIISNNEHYQRRHSADSPSGFELHPQQQQHHQHQHHEDQSDYHHRHHQVQQEGQLQGQGYNMLNNKHHYDSAQANNAHNHSALRGVTTSQSDSAIDELAHSNYYGGGNTSTAQVKATHSRPQLRNNNYMSSIATDQDDDLVEAEELPYHTDSAPSATTTTTTRLPQLSPHGTPPKKASFYYTDYEESAPEGAAAEETAGECTEYADPIEVFTYLDIEWKVYVTEENEVYYLDMGNEHSQWEDPREHGIIYHLEGGPAESPSGKFSEPPKSPSPKALEKSGGGRYGGGGSGAGNSFHFRQLEGEESPRVRDIKPIKLKWEVGDDDGCAADEGKLGSGDSFAVRSGKNRRLNMRHRKAAASEFSSDSSDDEIKSAVQVRYPRCRQQQQQQQISLIDAEEQGGSGCAIDNTAVLRTGNISPVGTIDLAEIHVTEKLENIENDTEDPSPADSPVENLQPVGKRNNNESRDSKAEEGAVPLFQRSNSDVPFESAEQLERGRIKLLAQEFNKAGGKPLSPVTSFHGASRSLAAAFALRDARAAAENGTTSGKETEAAHVNVSKPDSKPIAPIKESASARSVAPTPSASTGTSAATSTVASTSNVASTSSSGSVTISREEAEMYVQLIVSGKSLQEVGEIMDRDVCSQQFKLQVLAWADEATILTVPSLSADSFSSPSSGPNENAIAPEAAPVVVAQETIAMLKEDPVLMKYAKMLSMGVPPGNVLMKLKMENVEVSQRNRLMRAAGQEEEVDPNSSSAVPFAPAPAGAAMVRRPSANMQNLHWNTLPADKLKHSIWSQATGNAVNDIAETDLLELERLFGAQKDGGKGGSFATTRTLGALAHSQKEALQLFYLDKKRAQNIVIGLNPFKSLGTHVEILKALCSLNDIGGKITADHIDNFRNLLPTAEELKRIDKINGSKHPAELFFQAVMVFYPELPVRLNCFAACLNFNTNCEAVLARTKKLVNACNQVLSSNNLARLLQRMLAVGNIMNQGTRRGGASGFTLDSLIKMVNTKGVDKKTSVLDYVVKSLYDKQEESVLAVMEDLNLVEETAKVSGNEVLKEFSRVRSALNFLEQAYTENQKKNEVPSFNSPTAKKLIDEFSNKLEVYLSSFQGQMQECERAKLILRRKIEDVIKYFGEDPVSCDTVKIFGTLQEFLRAVAFSKAAVEWKLYRSQSM